MIVFGWIAIGIAVLILLFSWKSLRERENQILDKLEESELTADRLRKILQKQRMIKRITRRRKEQKLLRDKGRKKFKVVKSD